MVPSRHHSPRRGFTITEMLVTVGVIVVLAGILITALSAASRTAQKAKTDYLMQSIKSGIERFRADHGYIPPVLGNSGTAATAPGFGRDLLELPTQVDAGGGNFGTAAAEYNGWYSYTSLPEYLLGYDDRRMDGYGYVAPPILPLDDSEPGFREYPGLGMRSPGPDGVWNATLNPRVNDDPYLFINRNPGNLGNLSFSNTTQMPGKVYGPYIDLKDDSVIGEMTGLRADDSNALVARQEFDAVLLPGSDGYGTGANPKVFLDYWGNPIRFYRRIPENISNPARERQDLNLGDIIALRPHEFELGQEVESGFSDGYEDVFTTRGLQSAEFALFTAGPDRKSYDEIRRYDGDDEYNKDNIVKVGP